MPTTVRLDPGTEGLVRRMARKTGRTKSEVIREAIRRLADLEGDTRAPTLYDAMQHLIGTVRIEPSDLSERTGQRRRRLLAARRRP
jgi:hypothetical protein